MANIEEGSYVHYIPDHGEIENGRVKLLGKTFAFVVFKCNNEWERYEDYTGQRTPLIQLHLGWVDKDGNPIEIPQAISESPNQ